jgi:outer membrane receptor protein involved in Fe transport
LDLLGGLRFDLFAADFDSFVNNQGFNRTDTKVSWRAGLVFHPTPTQSYYFSLVPPSILPPKPGAGRQ